MLLLLLNVKVVSSSQYICIFIAEIRLMFDVFRIELCHSNF